MISFELKQLSCRLIMNLTMVQFFSYDISTAKSGMYNIWSF